MERGLRAQLPVLEDAPTEEVQEEIQKALSCEDLIKRYAEIQKISIEQAREEVGAPTEEEILKIEEVILANYHELSKRT